MERKFTPADIIEGQLPVEPTPQEKHKHHFPLLDRLINSQIVFDARKHVKKETEKPSANGR